MNDFKLTHRYEFTLPKTGDLDAWDSRLDICEKRRGVRGPETDWCGELDVTGDKPVGKIAATGSGQSTSSRNGIRILNSLRSAIDARIQELKEDRWKEKTLLPLQLALRKANVLAIVQIPIRNGDAGELRNSSGAKRIVMEAIEASAEHWDEVETSRDALRVEASERSLVISARNADIAIRAAEHYLTGLRRPPRRRVPVWAWGSVIVAALSVGASFAPLTTATLITMVVATAAVAAVTCHLAPRHLAKRLTTLLGLSVPITLIAFAAVYGAAALFDPGTFQVGSGPPHHLREPLLLSLGLLTTAGFIDFGVHDWLRSIAYFEMLLFAAFAGVAIIAAARSASELVASAVSELRRDREE